MGTGGAGSPCPAVPLPCHADRGVSSAALMLAALPSISHVALFGVKHTAQFPLSGRPSLSDSSAAAPAYRGQDSRTLPALSPVRGCALVPGPLDQIGPRAPLCAHLGHPGQSMGTWFPQTVCGSPQEQRPPPPPPPATLWGHDSLGSLSVCWRAHLSGWAGGRTPHGAAFRA